MINITSLEDIEALRESVDIECKQAQGKDGKGALPKDLWETYSAFANTHGGEIYLGLKERGDRSFELLGIKNPSKVLDELWTNLNNLQKVSGNILRERWVKVLDIEGKKIIQISIPQAPRKQKPVFIKGNPLKGTYKRLNSADLLQSEEVVRRMMAEQVEESRDTEILKGYGVDDLYLESLNTYRQRYMNLNPDHPWNQIDAQEFLYNIGAWMKDREAGHTGLTRAGLLMFGKLRAIKEAFPNYMLDYQERPEARKELRWVDRFTLDGTWSGNVFDFYNKVIRKLSSDLKVPFQLEGDQRQDDTLVHKALREALVNTLVHADYSGRSSVLIVKRPDMFGFRNPGLMRVPLKFAISGGESDCRNRLLQDMFRFIGLGENAGSGLPKIFHGWDSQHWRKPILHEKLEPSDQTLLELHTLSLVPEKIINELREMFGKERFDSLTENERLVLVTAQIETTVQHKRMMSILDIHPRDLTSVFAGLVEKELILQEGSGRGTIYFLHYARIGEMIDEVKRKLSQFEIVDIKASQGSSGDLKKSQGDLKNSSGDLKKSQGDLAALKEIAAPVANTKKTARSVVEETILKLCDRRELTLEELSKLLKRSHEGIRKDYLYPMVKTKKLRHRYPTNPSHPEQAYTKSDK